MDKMRAARKKWVRPLAELPLWRATDWVDMAGKRQLRATLAAMESCTSLNCWYGEYEAARLLQPRVIARLRSNTQ